MHPSRVAVLGIACEAMNELVALDLPGGAAFVEALQRVWARGDAAMPIDRRLPPPARAALLAAMRPAILVDIDGEHPLDGGEPIEPGDALVMATSGSTGTPKGVILAHDAVAASAVATSARLGITADDVWLACLPLSHVGGLGVVTRALATGTRLVVHDGFDADAVERAAGGGATAVSLVATALGRIRAELFRVIVVGGARPPASLPPNAVTTYGLTESGGGVVYDRRPLDGVEVRIVDGEVQLRGPMLLRRYRDGTSPITADGWLATGDLGHVDADGLLYVEGRRGDLIVTGGENVWPDTVEATLRTATGVVDCAIAGVPDEEWGARVVAWVVPGPTPPTLADLRLHVAESLPAFMAPKELRFVEEIPRTALGKVSRGRLTGSQ